MSLTVLILAAGQGTRMKSRRAKVLHELAGRPLIGHVCRTALALAPNRVIAIVGHQGEAVSEAFLDEMKKLAPEVAAETVVQAEQRGTGHAVRMAEASLAGTEGTLLVLSGDVPLLTSGTLEKLLKAHRSDKYAATVLTTEMPDPTGYGRVVRQAVGDFGHIVEHRDASPAELEIREINAGIYAFEMAGLFPSLEKITPANAQGEYYLPDTLKILKNEGHAIGVVCHPANEEVLGINSRSELAAAAAHFRHRKLAELMRDGVTILDPATTYVEADVTIGMDSIIYPNVTLEGTTVVGENCRIHSGSRLSNAVLADNVTVKDYSLVFDSRLDADSAVGPFAHLRMNAHLRAGAVVGNFVEVKKSTLGEKTKAMHLSYLGDATLGERVNIGAGTITCNYDGKNKHATVIEDGVKIGSDTMLVAPVTVGAGSMTGAGSVVTRDVPENTLVAGVPATVKRKLDTPNQ